MNKILFNLAIICRTIVYILFYFINKYIIKQKAKIIILCYHSIEKNSWRFTVTPDNFKEQIYYLKNIGYQFISLSDIEKYLNNEKEINKPSVVLNFDDGYKNILTISEFLKHLKINPSLFLISETENPNRNELGNNQEFLSIKEIKKLQEYGWEIGNHSATHSNLSLLSENQLQKEIISSKMTISNQLNLNIKYFAYPRGKYNKSVLKIVKKTGYKLGLTMDDGKITKDINSLTIPRIGIDGTHSKIEFMSTILPITIAFRKFIKSTKLGEYL